MKRFILLAFVSICIFTAKAQENFIEKDMKQLQDAVAMSDTLKIKSLRKEYIANIDSRSNEDEAYMYYNLMVGISHIYLAEFKEAIPYYVIVYDSCLKLAPKTKEWEKLLSDVAGSLGVCYAQSDTQKEAMHYAELSVKHAQKSKMEKQVAMARFWLAQVYTELKDFPKAYKTIQLVKTKVEDNITYQSFPEYYSIILNGMAKLAIENNQTSKIKSYYNELKNLLAQYPESGAFSIIGDEFIIELITYALKRNENIANKLLHDILEGKYVGHQKYIEQENQKSKAQFYSDRCLTLAELADKKQNGPVTLFLIEQLFKIDKSQISAEQWALGIIWIAHYQVKYKDVYKDAVDLLYRTLIADRNNLSHQSAKSLIWQMLHTVHRALFHIRMFSDSASGEKFTDSYTPVLPSEDTLYIITKWSEILDYLTSEYGEKYINNILSSFNAGKSGLDIVGYSKQDMQRFLAEYYIYYQQYDKFDKVFQQFVNTCNLTTKQQLLLFYLNSEDLYQNKEAVHAYSFLNHIKNSERYNANIEIIKWVESRIKDLDSWVSNNVTYAQQCTQDGKIEDAIYWYNAVLKHIEKNKGRKAEYAEVLTFKASSLYFSKKYNESIKSAKEALDIIKSYNPNDFYDRYSTLKTLYLCYESQNEYANAIPYMQEALNLLKHKYQDNDYYKKDEEIVYTYYSLITTYDKLGKNEELSIAAKGATEYIIANYETIKALNIDYVIALIVQNLISLYNSFSADAMQGNNYASCLSSYQEAISLLKYSINGYYEIYSTKDNSPFLFLLKHSYSNDRPTFDRLIEDYWKYSEQSVLDAAALQLIPHDEIAQNIAIRYENLAMICRHNDLNLGSIKIYGRLLEYLAGQHINNWSRIHNIYLSMANIYQRGIKDYCKSMEYHIKSIEASIAANGHNHQSVFESFDAAKNMYYICSAYSTRLYGMRINPDGYSKVYEQDAKLYKLWYNIQDDLANKYGDDYLKSLYRYNYNANREFDIKNQGYPRPHSIVDDLDWKGQMIYDKIHLSILYNHVEDFEKTINKLWEHLGLLKAHQFIVDIADKLSKRGYYDHAIWLLEAFRHSIVKTEELGTWSPIAENIDYCLATTAWDYNKYSDAIMYLMGIEFAVRYSYERVHWHDTQTMVESLYLLAQYYKILDVEKSKKYISLIEDIVTNNIVGKNGKPLNDDAIANMYNMLSIITVDYTEREQHLLKAIEHSSQWNYGYNINLAYVYTMSGKYDKADVLLPKIINYAKNNYLNESWQESVLINTVMNAIWKKDSSKAKIESTKRLNTIIKMYLQKSKTLTSESRSALWDYSYGNTLKWFSMVDLVNDGDASVSYDATLFHKSILLSQRSIIDNNIRNSSDDELKIVHNKYMDAIKRQTDSIDMFESRMMYLYSKHPEFVDNYKPTKWQDVQSHLGKKDVAIEFALTEASPMSKSKFVALLLKHDAPNPIVVPLCDEEELRNIIANNLDKDGYLSLYDKDPNPLYEKLWLPLERHLKGVKNIYFAPYDILNNINFSAIRVGDTKKYLIDVYKLQRLSTTAQLCSSSMESNSQNVVAFGGVDYNNYQDVTISSNHSAQNVKDDESLSKMRGYVESWNTLSGALTEVKEIESMLNGGTISTQIYTSTNASEENFKKLSGDSISIVHLATHGYYFTPNDAQKMVFFNNPHEEMPKNMDTGARSGLILSGGNLAWKGEAVIGKEDGVLTAKEILGMDFSSVDLMVLSACQTALGDIRNDGVYGMQRNLKMAGANTMIMSLWKVDDNATKDMMSAFYRNIVKGIDKRKAFDIAVTHTRKKYKRESNSCKFWAPFVMLD